MSPERRAEVVAVLEKHQFVYTGSATCLCGRAFGWREPELRMAEHQLDMLVKAGFEPFRPIDVVPSGP